MSHATGPRPKRSKKRRNPYHLRIWPCGLCNTRCKTVLGPGGLCSVCRQQPPLPGVNDFPQSGGEW
jgi:hypothetical protein